jgi:hypothetical protein
MAATATASTRKGALRAPSLRQRSEAARIYGIEPYQKGDQLRDGSYQRQDRRWLATRTRPAVEVIRGKIRHQRKATTVPHIGLASGPTNGRFPVHQLTKQLRLGRLRRTLNQQPNSELNLVPERLGDHRMMERRLKMVRPIPEGQQEATMPDSADRD